VSGWIVSRGLRSEKRILYRWKVQPRTWYYTLVGDVEARKNSAFLAQPHPDRDSVSWTSTAVRHYCMTNGDAHRAAVPCAPLNFTYILIGFQVHRYSSDYPCIPTPPRGVDWSPNMASRPSGRRAARFRVRMAGRMGNSIRRSITHGMVSIYVTAPRERGSVKRALRSMGSFSSGQRWLDRALNRTSSHFANGKKPGTKSTDGQEDGARIHRFSQPDARACSTISKDRYQTAPSSSLTWAGHFAIRDADRLPQSPPYRSSHDMYHVTSGQVAARGPRIGNPTNRRPTDKHWCTSRSPPPAQTAPSRTLPLSH